VKFIIAWLLISLVIVYVCLGTELAVFEKVIICPSWSERPLIIHRKVMVINIKKYYLLKYKTDKIF